MNTGPNTDILGIRDWVRERLGIAYSDRGLEILTARVESARQKLGFPTVSRLRQAIASDPNSMAAAVLADAVSTNHTAFFREPETFKHFAEHILEPLCHAGREVRIWSAAASTGEEAYSLAMLLHERLGPHGASRFRILGTDISRAAVAQAESGRYEAHSRSVDGRYQAYVRDVGAGHFEVTPEIRQMCMFRRLNLMSERYPFAKKFDVIFCRNVLYYFSTQEQERVLGKLAGAAAKNGVLVTSLTESVHGLDVCWDKTHPAFYRLGAA